MIIDWVQWDGEKSPGNPTRFVIWHDWNPKIGENRTLMAVEVPQLRAADAEGSEQEFRNKLQISFVLFYSDHVRPTPNLSFWFILSHVLFTRTSLGPTTQHVQHMKQVDLSSHSASHSYRFSPFSRQNTMFNIWTNLASWVMFEMSFPSPTTRQYVEQMKKVGILSHDWNLQLVDPTMQYVQRMKKVDMWSPFFEIYPPWAQPSNIYMPAPTKHYIQHRSAWTSHLEPCFTCPFPTFANQYVEYMNKVEMSRHLYILNSSPSPVKQYLEQTKEWAFDIYNSVTLHCNTLNMWS